MQRVFENIYYNNGGIYKIYQNRGYNTHDVDVLCAKVGSNIPINKVLV